MLQTWSIDDLNHGFEIWGDPEVMKFIDNGKNLNLDQVKLSIEAAIRHQEIYGFQHWAVIELESGKLIGACGFNRTDEVEAVELVFHFAKSYWGKGYATEAAKSCIKFAISDLGIKKIIAGCHPGNESSKRVLLKLGFEFKGNKFFEDTGQDEPCFELLVGK
jgi:ribosomal-protein-alanine N-acetyltransferase